MRVVFCVSVGQTEKELCHTEGKMFDFKKKGRGWKKFGKWKKKKEVGA